MGDDAFAKPSSLPDWTRAHVLTHVARNADAHDQPADLGPHRRPDPALQPAPSSATRTSRPAPSARPRRSAPTSSRRRTGSPRPCGRCRRRPGRRGSDFRGRRILASDVLWLRAREVWIHAIDLDAGASFSDLPRPMLRELLTDAAVTMGARPGLPAAAARAHRRAADVDGGGGAAGSDGGRSRYGGPPRSSRRGCSAGRRGVTCVPPRGSGRPALPPWRRLDGTVPRLRRGARRVRRSPTASRPRCSPRPPRRPPRAPRRAGPGRRHGRRAGDDRPAGVQGPRPGRRRRRRRGDGFRVHYAIADLGAVVVPGAALDTEVRRRGQTVYLPDGSVPLHPPVLSEDAASLLPDGPRAAVLWPIDLDGAGEPVSVEVRRAVVRSRARLDYAGVQASVDAGTIAPGDRGAPGGRAAAPRPGRAPRGDRAGAARAGGRARRRRTAAGPSGSGSARPSRTGTRRSRCSPAPRRPRHHARRRDRRAAHPARAEPEAVTALRAAARGLGIDWPAARPRPSCCPALPRDTPAALACAGPPTSLLRGAGYTAFDTAGGAPPPADPGHAGIGAPYAHVTAPLRRLVDRFGTEVCLAVDRRCAPCPTGCARPCPPCPRRWRPPTRWPARWTRACVDRTEAALLAGPRRGGVRRGRAAGVDRSTAPGEVFLPTRPCWPAVHRSAAAGGDDTGAAGGGRPGHGSHRLRPLPGDHAVRQGEPHFAFVERSGVQRCRSVRPSGTGSSTSSRCCARRDVRRLHEHARSTSCRPSSTRCPRTRPT